MCGVYMIKNKINGKFYIGSSVDITYRWARHKRQLRNGNHHSIHLQRAWDKYGEENFEFKVIEECSEDMTFKRVKPEIPLALDGGMNGVRGNYYKLLEKQKSSQISITISPDFCL